jgi:hypothetical protein
MHSHHEHHTEAGDVNFTKMAISATLHCLTGCAIGEILGMVIGTALGWHDIPMIALAIALAFLFGYGLTLMSVRRHGVGFKEALKIALAADTASIVTMEIVDNLILILIPGALMAGTTTPLFWGSLVVALAIAFVVTVPVNRAMIKRGKGHAVAHTYHHHG